MRRSNHRATLDRVQRLLFYFVLASLLFIATRLLYACAPSLFEVRGERALNGEFLRVLSGASHRVTSGAAIKASTFFQTKENLGVVIGVAAYDVPKTLQPHDAPFTCVISGSELLKCEYSSEVIVLTDDSKLYVLTSLGNSPKSLKIEHSLHVLGKDKHVEEELIINGKAFDVERGRVFYIRLDHFNDVADIEQRMSAPFSWMKDHDYHDGPWMPFKKVAANVKHWLDREMKSITMDRP